MRSARTAKHIIIGLLLLGILLVGGWYFLYPYSLGSRISASEPLSLSVNITGVTVTGKDTVDTVTYEFQPDTQEYKALVSLLGYRSEIVLHYLEQREVYVSSGSACSRGASSGVLELFGAKPAEVDSALRISFCAENTEEDIAALVQGLRDAQKELMH